MSAARGQLSDILAVEMGTSLRPHQPSLRTIELELEIHVT
jgi:hypothetical protein